MPRYDYICKHCKVKFEITQSIKDAPLTICKDCKGELKKLITGIGGFILKGPGFYVNDYKKDSKE